ncbi:MAG: response regulator transcription factor [Chitinophagaceae bacterium]
MSTVLIADDHTITRYGLSLLIREIFPQTEVQETETFYRVLYHLEKTPYDMLILDINIPGGDSLQMISAIRLRQPRIKILVFTAYDEQLFALHYMHAGADGFLMKHAPEQEIRTAIRTVLAEDKKYVSHAVQQHLLNDFTTGKSLNIHPLLTLSDREAEVMQLMAKGIALAEIAKILSLQLSTISTYKKRIFDKLQVSNIVELIDQLRIYNNSFNTTSLRQKNEAVPPSVASRA